MTASNRVRVYMGCSLDGVIAGPDDDLSFLDTPGPANSPPSSPEALQFDAFMAEVGAMLMGRRTYDVVDAMDVDWPYGDTPVLVATHRPLTGAPPTVRSVSGDIASVVAEAKAAAGDKDVYLDGGLLIRQALAAGLVDEMCLTILPLIHGDGGVRLFDGLQGLTKLAFVSHQAFEGGMIQITARPR
ncbi:MAG: dihydrofolate reductase [Myxococcales bacterium]|nr:dihydrofolate reductase [Myxococcales bacterium]